MALCKSCGRDLNLPPPFQNKCTACKIWASPSISPIRAPTASVAPIHRATAHVPSRGSHPMPPILTPPTGTRAIGTMRTLRLTIDYINFDMKTDPLLIRAKTITIGDLHGNTLTLFILLVKMGALIPRASGSHIFTTIRRVVVKASDDTTPINQNDYDDFLSALSSCEVNRNPSRSMIRLIGDVLADRVSNDALTLTLLNLLFEVEYPIIILYSNHDHEFMLYLSTPKGKIVPFNMSNPNMFLASLQRFRIFMMNPFIRHETKRSMLGKVLRYTRAIQMFDYEWQNPAPGAPSAAGVLDFCIFSHASFNLEIFEGTAKSLSQGLLREHEHVTTSTELIHFIESANDGLLGALNREVFVWQINMWPPFDSPTTPSFHSFRSSTSSESLSDEDASSFSKSFASMVSLPDASFPEPPTTPAAVSQGYLSPSIDAQDAPLSYEEYISSPLRRFFYPPTASDTTSGAPEMLVSYGYEAIWRRYLGDHPSRKTTNTPLTGNEPSPFRNLRGVHGHDQYTQSPRDISLDQETGKGNEDFALHNAPLFVAITI